MYQITEARLPRRTHFWQFLALQYLALPLLCLFFFFFFNVISNAFYVYVLKEGNCRKERPNVIAFQIWT